MKKELDFRKMSAEQILELFYSLGGNIDAIAAAVEGKARPPMVYAALLFAAANKAAIEVQALRASKVKHESILSIYRQRKAIRASIEARRLSRLRKRQARSE